MNRADTETHMNDRGGRPVEFPDEAFLESLRDLGATPEVGAVGGGVTTDQVAAEVGCAYRTAHQKLTALKEDGRVASRRVGGRHLWRLAGEVADDE